MAARGETTNQTTKRKDGAREGTRAPFSLWSSCRREENLSATAEEHEANELGPSRESGKFARTDVRGYLVVVADVTRR